MVEKSFYWILTIQILLCHFRFLKLFLNFFPVKPNEIYSYYKLLKIKLYLALILINRCKCNFSGNITVNDLLVSVQ